jgi:hypothetical protein
LILAILLLIFTPLSLILFSTARRVTVNSKITKSTIYINLHSRASIFMRIFPKEFFNSNYFSFFWKIISISKSYLDIYQYFRSFSSCKFYSYKMTKHTME